MWIQEHNEHTSTVESFRQQRPDVLRGRLLGRLQLIVTILDPLRRNFKNKPLKYTGAFIELFKWRNQGQIHETHGMLEVESWPLNNIRKSRMLNARRFYEISNIIHCAHVVPAGESSSIFYVNYWIDWEAYNTIYDPDFLAKNYRAAIKLSKQFK